MRNNSCHFECNKKSERLKPRLFVLFILALFVLLAGYCSMPSTSFATSVGFVPSTGLWFSRTNFLPHETVRIYTVVINNDFYSLDGTVSFYDNGQIIDTVDVKGVLKESVKEIRVFWEPTEGEHSVSAQFTRAVATDEKGARQILDVDTINSIAGAPLKVGSDAVSPSPVIGISSSTSLGSVTITTTAQAGAVFNTAVATGGAVNVVVKKDGSKLTMVANLADTSNSRVATQAGAPSTVSSDKAGVGDLLAKNREILDKASQFAGTITSTAGKINEAYNTTHGAIEKGRGYYAQVKDVWSKTAPYVEQAAPVWNTVSHNNDPRYIIGIVGGIIFLWYVIRWRWRHHRVRDRYSD